MVATDPNQSIALASVPRGGCLEKQSSIKANVDQLVSTVCSWPFVVSLALLLANDLYLKLEYPGLITGKLSDVSGIFLVTYLSIGLFPRAKLPLSAAVAVLFVVWKLPVSQWAIDTINSNISVRIGRVVDYSDLLALAAIPLAWACAARCSDSESPRFWKRAIATPIVVVAFLGITGTSVLMPYGNYSIRNTELDSRIEDTALSNAARRVAESFELQCTQCDALSDTAHYYNDDMDFWFRVDKETNGIEYRVSVKKMTGFPLANGDFDLFHAFQRRLKHEIGRLSPNMVFIESLDPAKQDPYSF